MFSEGPLNRASKPKRHAHDRIPRLQVHTRRNGRILLVDDDSDLRRLMRAFLIAEGYEVFSSSNGARALEVFAGCEDIDLLLTDLEMPGMSGVELSQRLCAAKPGLSVLIVSGSIVPDDLLNVITTNGWRFIPKPYLIPQLLEAIADKIGLEPISLF